MNCLHYSICGWKTPACVVLFFQRSLFILVVSCGVQPFVYLMVEVVNACLVGAPLLIGEDPKIVTITCPECSV